MLVATRNALEVALTNIYRNYNRTLTRKDFHRAIRILQHDDEVIVLVNGKGCYIEGAPNECDYEPEFMDTPDGVLEFEPYAGYLAKLVSKAHSIYVLSIGIVTVVKSPITYLKELGLIDAESAKLIERGAVAGPPPQPEEESGMEESRTQIIQQNPKG